MWCTGRSITAPPPHHHPPSPKPSHPSPESQRCPASAPPATAPPNAGAPPPPVSGLAPPPVPPDQPGPRRHGSPKRRLRHRPPPTSGRLLRRHASYRRWYVRWKILRFGGRRCVAMVTRGVVTWCCYHGNTWCSHQCNAWCGYHDNYFNYNFVSGEGQMEAYREMHHDGQLSSFRVSKTVSSLKPIYNLETMFDL